jgi:hypothetical protein
MNRPRHRRLRARLSILAIVALLWSQVLLAGHPACSMAAMALADITVPAAADHGCHHQGPATESAICEAHCSQGDLSSDVGRIPPIPASAPALAIEIASITTLETGRAPWAEAPPPLSWHRPTAHPASLLLI